jgi:ribosome small subunit-dependent GTPase A
MSSVATQQGLVTATFGQRMRLRLEDGSEVTARLKGKKMRPVCGDLVETREIPNEPEWLITDILPRRNELSRPDRRGRVEVLAANIDLIAVITADAPITDWFIVDRYLAAAELIDASALIVFNKTDLGVASESSAAELADFANVGYTTVRCSAKTGENMSELREHLNNYTAIIVGQSGVGKSSLINALVAHHRQFSDVVAAARRCRNRFTRCARLCARDRRAGACCPGIQRDCRSRPGLSLRELPPHAGTGLCRQGRCRKRGDQRAPLRELPATAQDGRRPALARRPAKLAPPEQMQMHMEYALPGVCVAIHDDAVVGISFPRGYVFRGQEQLPDDFAI